jgi:hypothetical protein
VGLLRAPISTSSIAHSRSIHQSEEPKTEDYRNASTATHSTTKAVWKHERTAPSLAEWKSADTNFACHWSETKEVNLDVFLHRSCALLITSSSARGNPANTIAASTAQFPSAYTFATNNEDEARAKRARRFEREMELERERKQGGPSFLPRQINGHDDPHHRSALDVTDDVGVRKMTLGNLGVGVSAGGKRKWLGSRLGMDDLADPDPVSRLGHTP